MTKTFIVMHGGLKLDADAAKAAKLDPKNPVAPLGTKLELEEEFVAKVDPAGVQFVTLEQYEALREKVEANEAAEASIAKMRETAETAAQKLAAERVNAKLMVAVKAIEAAKAKPVPAAKAKPVPAHETHAAKGK